MFNFVYPPRSQQQDEEPEPTREEVVSFLKLHTQKALEGTLAKHDVGVIDLVLIYIKSGQFSKEEFELTDEHISQLKAIVEADSAKRKKIIQVQILYDALWHENNKLYLFRPGKKKRVLKEKAIQLKKAMAEAGLSYADCHMIGTDVEKFAKA
jgi:hypothetical protein